MVGVGVAGGGFVDRIDRIEAIGIAILLQFKALLLHRVADGVATEGGDWDFTGREIGIVVEEKAVGQIIHVPAQNGVRHRQRDVADASVRAGDFKPRGGGDVELNFPV